MMYYEDLHINPMDPHDNPFLLRPEIRQTISLITSVCVGLPALVWAFRLLHLQRKIRGRISAFIILLLLISSLIQLPLNLYSVIQLKKLHLNPKLLQFWSLLSFCSFHLHQLVATEAALSHIFSRSCCIITSIFVLIFSLPFIFMDLFGNLIIFIFFCFCTFLLLLCLFAAVVCGVTCHICSPSFSKKTCLVLIVAFINFILFLAMLNPVDFLRKKARPHWTFMSPHFMGLRAMLDPLLCVLVCRGNLNDAQTPQTHTEPNADQTSV